MMYACILTARVTPTGAAFGSTRDFNTSKHFLRAIDAKRAAAALAFKSNIVNELRCNNTIESSILRELDLPVPASLEEHDIPDQQNSLQRLTELVQKATGSQSALSFESIWKGNIAREAHEKSMLSFIVRPTARCDTYHQSRRSRTLAVYDGPIPEKLSCLERGSLSSRFQARCKGHTTGV